MRISDWSSDVCSSDLSDEAIREFRQWDDAGIMVVQPQAASLGIDLSTSSKMIWYGLIPSYVDYTQCCDRSEEHTSELQSLMRISYAVFCLKKKKTKNMTNSREQQIQPHNQQRP